MLFRKCWNFHRFMSKINPQYIRSSITKGPCGLDLFTRDTIDQHPNHVMSHLRMAINPYQGRDYHMPRLCIVKYLVKREYSSVEEIYQNQHAGSDRGTTTASRKGSKMSMYLGLQTHNLGMHQPLPVG
jgi:hypothetical protein